MPGAYRQFGNPESSPGEPDGAPLPPELDGPEDVTCVHAAT